MARHFRGALIAALIASGTFAAAAERRPQAELPPVQTERPDGRQEKRGSHDDRGPWWKNPRYVGELGLTADQSSKIDKIFRIEVEKMKVIRAEINELERGVDATMRANTNDIAAFARQVEQVERKRAELNKARTVMLYRMRRVLNAAQHVKFQALHDRDVARKKQDADRRR